MSIIENRVSPFEAVRADAERYRKLRRWMTSNVKEGWSEVEQLAAIGVYMGWDEMDKNLDALPVCNVGLNEIRNAYEIVEHE